MRIEFHGLPSDQVHDAKTQGCDAYGLPPEVHTAQGSAYPCRHCLRETPEGEDYLILAWRPFEGVNPYTETGPIFLCAEDCAAAAPSDAVPPILRSAQYMVRGYTADERILYGTGQIVATGRIAEYARQLLTDPRVAFADVRSASNNCYQCRITRAGS
ncbi:DUF1203 domain-containing protein [Roseovarius pelagicus]|uniref:DUF1203 domain-containing protein n=1 Tax=Roseovarius pelagicus TaxID=2980108 RepID=A0ABY6D8C7_9RHOB|nr:DUF1203 domain-containing protein [Roseovarius pelagicus]UXX82164.1 DUF1203 domain-containing protein [Roseovarius pelagicus]